MGREERIVVDHHELKEWGGGLWEDSGLRILRQLTVAWGKSSIGDDRWLCCKGVGDNTRMAGQNQRS